MAKKNNKRKRDKPTNVSVSEFNYPFRNIVLEGGGARGVAYGERFLSWRSVVYYKN